jgi:hypothetical protein
MTVKIPRSLVQRATGPVIVASVLVALGYGYYAAVLVEPVKRAAPINQPTAPAKQPDKPKSAAAAVPAPNLAAARQHFASAEWRLEGVTVAASAGIAPDGSNGAALVAETAGDGRHRLEVAPVAGATPGAIHTLSVYVKPASQTAMALEMRDAHTVKYGLVKFNLAQTAVVGKTGDVTDAGIEPLPGGWFRCWAAMPYGGDVAVFNIALADGDQLLYPGRAGSGVLIWGVKLEQGTQPTLYTDDSSP